jgi:hypothetical protein
MEGSGAGSGSGILFYGILPSEQYHVVQEAAPCSPGREVEDQLIWVNYLVFFLITVPTVVKCCSLIRFVQQLSVLQVRF